MWNTLCFIAVNFIINNMMSKTYREKMSLLIEQGVYHANSGDGPYIVFGGKE